MSAFTWAVVLLAGLTCTTANLGNQVSIYDYAYIAQVEDRIGTLWLQQCVSTIITNFHLLTAAGCVTNARPNTCRIRVGTPRRGVEGTVKEIESFTNHPSFGLLGKDGDLSIIHLESALTWGNTVQQIPILGEGIQLPEGLPVSLLGWGTTAQGGLASNNDLFLINLFTKSDQQCLLQYLQADNPQTITENMLCTGLSSSSGRDLDSRDAGAPITYQSTLVGVASFGVSRGNDEYPIVSTLISSYTNWIIETTAPQ